MATIIYNVKLRNEFITADELVSKIDEYAKKDKNIEPQPLRENSAYRAIYHLFEDKKGVSGIVGITEIEVSDVRSAIVEVNGTERECLRTKSKLLEMVEGLELY